METHVLHVASGHVMTFDFAAHSIPSLCITINVLQDAEEPDLGHTGVWLRSCCSGKSAFAFSPSCVFCICTLAVTENDYSTLSLQHQEFLV